MVVAERRPQLQFGASHAMLQPRAKQKTRICASMDCDWVDGDEGYREPTAAIYVVEDHKRGYQGPYVFRYQLCKDPS